MVCKKYMLNVEIFMITTKYADLFKILSPEKSLNMMRTNVSQKEQHKDDYRRTIEIL